MLSFRKWGKCVGFIFEEKLEVKWEKPPVLNIEWLWELGGRSVICFSDEFWAFEWNKVISWHRYIDDVFKVWAELKEELTAFLEGLEKNTYNLKFTYNFNLEIITFLKSILMKQAPSALLCTGSPKLEIFSYMPAVRILNLYWVVSRIASSWE